MNTIARLPNPSAPHPQQSVRFDRAYREEVRIPGGQRLCLRTVLPSDKPRLVRGLQELSPASNRARFFARKSRLTEAALRYFTEFDGIDHHALGLDQRGSGTVRDPDHDLPDAAA